MVRITVKQYAHFENVKRDTINKRIQKSIKSGTNKLDKNVYFEKPFRDYIIEITGPVEKLYKSLKVDSELSQE